MSSRPADCLIADDALSRGAWSEARGAFDEALRVRESPEALEGLGVAAWWLDLADVVFDVRERAYRLFRARDDRAGAARVAVWLAWDYWAFRGEHAVANGWLQRARRLLDGQPDSPERAWLELREGALALLESDFGGHGRFSPDGGLPCVNSANEKSKRYSGPSLRNLTFAARCAGNVGGSTSASRAPSRATSRRALVSCVARVALSNASVVTTRASTCLIVSIGRGLP